jgi:hypothetical protein
MTLLSTLLPRIASVKHYLFFNGFYLVSLVLYIVTSTYHQNFYNSFLFYFYAPYSNFKSWFPQFYFPAFIFVVFLKTTLFIGILALTFYLFKRITRSNQQWKYNQHSGYWRFISYELLIVFIFFLFYLGFYFLTKQLLPYTLLDSVQHLLAKGFLLYISFHATFIIAGNFNRVKLYLNNYLLEPQLPYNLSLLRILFFTYMIFIYLAMYNFAMPIVSLTARVPLPFIGWFIDIIPINTKIYSIFLWLGIISCVFILLGFKTRWFLLINAVCVFYVISTPNFFGKLGHRQLVIWICWIFAFSKCFDAFSLDSKWNKTEVVKSADYTFPIRFIWLQLGIIYLWAGFYKLWDGGFDWALGQSMINQVQLEWLQHYDTMPAIRIDRYPVLLKIGGLLVIGFELCYILLMLKPASRWVAAIGGLVMHNVIGYFMYIAFLHLLQAFYFFYIDFTGWFSKGKENTKTVFGYSKLAFGTGITILSLNFCCGMFSIDTYPFSAYPKYSAIIPNNIKIIHFEAYLQDSSLVNVHSIGKKNNFRWESYGWLEYNLINDFEQGQNVQKRLNDYWAIWQSHNPELRSIKKINVFIKQRPVAPEGIHNCKTVAFMGTIEPHN